MVILVNGRWKQGICIAALLAASSMLPAHAEQSLTEYERLCSQQKALLFKREYTQALELMNRWIASGERLPAAYKLRSEIYTAMHSYEKAIADADTAIELDPDFRPAYVARATAYMRMGDDDKAIVAWKQCLQHLNQDAAKAGRFETDSTVSSGAWEQTNIGYIHAKKGDYAAAICAFNVAILLEPGICTEAYFLRGLAREYQGQLKEAVSDYAQALKQDPYLVPALQHAAVVSEVLGRDKDVLSFRTVLAALESNSFVVKKRYQLLPEKLTDEQLAAWKQADEKFRDRG